MSVFLKADVATCLVFIFCVIPACGGFRSLDASGALWTASITLPQGAKVQPAARGNDRGWGVTIDTSTDGMVKASIEDDDGDGFFEVQVNDGSCKVDVGSNGLGPGLTVEVYAQNNLSCVLSGGPSGQDADYSLSLTATYQQGLYCDREDETGTKEPCGKVWYSQEAKPHTESLAQLHASNNKSLPGVSSEG